MAYLAGEYAEAERLQQSSLTMFQQIGDRQHMALVLNQLGNISDAIGSY